MHSNVIAYYANIIQCWFPMVELGPTLQLVHMMIPIVLCICITTQSTYRLLLYLSECRIQFLRKNLASDKTLQKKPDPGHAIEEKNKHFFLKSLRKTVSGQEP